MKIQTLTKIALAGLLFAGTLFTTGCEKTPGEKVGDAVKDAGDAIKDATN